MESEVRCLVPSHLLVFLSTGARKKVTLLLVLRGAPWVWLLCKEEGWLPAGPEGGKFLCWLCRDWTQRWQLSSRKFTSRCAAVLSDTLCQRNTGPSQSSQNQQASSWNPWRQNYAMRYTAYLVHPKAASLTNCFQSLAQLCFVLAQKKLQDFLFHMYIYLSEWSSESAFQYFQR